MELDRLEYYIGQRLKNLTDLSVYNWSSKKIASFPYLVFKFKPCNYVVRTRKDWVLELDFWDDKKDNSDLISASITVKNGRGEYKGLHYSTQNESEGFYVCRIVFESPIEDPEPNIARYNQRYILQVD